MWRYVPHLSPTPFIGTSPEEPVGAKREKQGGCGKNTDAKKIKIIENKDMPTDKCDK